MNAAEPSTATTTLASRSAALLATATAPAGLRECVTPARAARTPLRRPPSRSLVLAQSWIPFSVTQRGQPGMRQSTLRAAEAFTLLSSQLATRRGGETSSTP